MGEPCANDLGSETVFQFSGEYAHFFPSLHAQGGSCEWQ